MVYSIDDFINQFYLKTRQNNICGQLLKSIFYFLIYYLYNLNAVDYNQQFIKNTILCLKNIY